MSEASRQYAVGCRQWDVQSAHGHRASRIHLPTANCLLPTDRPTGHCLPPTGFTLVEMLIVMAIIVLAITLAVPAIRLLTGSRSEQAAQNVVSAYLASARADAVALQEIDGVLFYIDPATDRVTMQEVCQSVQPTDPGGIVYLDLEAGVHPSKARDPLALPPGIRLMTMLDRIPYGSTTLVDSFSTGGVTARYLGYNAYPAAGLSTTTMLGGVILFDGNGRVYTGRYGFRFLSYLAAPADKISPLGHLAYATSATSPTVDWPSGVDANEALYGQIAFTFYDRQTFLNHIDTGTNKPFLDNNQGAAGLSVNVNPEDGPNAGQQQAWLDVNTTPIFVNRYNSTLTRAE